MKTINRRLVAVAAATWLLGVSIWAQAPQPGGYLAFAKLAEGQRAIYWQEASPEEKADIAQGHARAWLSSNQGRLNKKQVQAVTAVIAMLTPDFYGDPQSDKSKAIAATMHSQLACNLWKSEVVAAFRPTRPEIRVSWADDVSTWISSCYFGR